MNVCSSYALPVTIAGPTDGNDGVRVYYQNSNILETQPDGTNIWDDVTNSDWNKMALNFEVGSKLLFAFDSPVSSISAKVSFVHSGVGQDFASAYLSILNDNSYHFMPTPDLVVQVYQNAPPASLDFNGLGNKFSFVEIGNYGFDNAETIVCNEITFENHLTHTPEPSTFLLLCVGMLVGIGILTNKKIHFKSK